MPHPTRPLDPPAAPDPLAIVREARHRLGLGDGILETLVLGSLDVVLGHDVPTMAVALRPTGVARVTANPDFIRAVGVEGTAFVLSHEAFHVLLGHLGTPTSKETAKLAREVVVNHWVLRSGHPGLPRLADGTEVGVAPHAVHRRYTEAVGDDAVDYDTFVSTDEVCARELARAQLLAPVDDCSHPDDPVPREVAAAIDELLEHAVRRAADGDRRLRAQLLSLEAATAASPTWDHVGVTELRGVAARLGATGFWRHHLRAVVGRLLRDRTVVAYDRKTGWWDPAVLAAAGMAVPPGTGMPLHHVRRTARRRRVAIHLDTSGSIPPPVVDHLAATVGPLPETDVAWHTFDHEVHPFAPGDPLVGGGGTDFGVVVDHVDGLDPAPDAVLVLTDGHAPPARPSRPERWVWLVLEGGNPWPARHGMAVVPVSLPTSDPTHP